MRLIWSRVGSISPLSHRETVAWLTSAIAAKADWVIPKTLRRMFSIGFIGHEYTHVHYIGKKIYTYANFLRRKISDMQIRMTKLGANIKALRADRKLSQAAFADLIGVTQPTISRLESGGDAESETLAKIAAFAGVTIEHLMERPIGALQDDYPNEKISRDRLKPDLKPGKPTGMAEGLSGFFPRTSDIPVLESRPGSWPEMIVSEEPSDMMERPDKMIIGKKASAFALVISSNNMGPAIEPGNLVIVNESRHPLPGDDALFCSGRGSGQFRAIAARLLRETADDWHVRYFEPQSPTESAKILSKENWPSAFRITAKISL
jgi:transcriptional regulator with XRE-family HTH domain